MTDHPAPAADRPGSVARSAVWLVASLAVAVLGWLLVAISDWQVERLAGGVLLAAAALGLVTAVLVLRGAGPEALPGAASAVLAVAGVAAAALVASRGDAFLVDVLVVVGVGVAAGAAGFLASRGR